MQDYEFITWQVSPLRNPDNHETLCQTNVQAKHGQFRPFRVQSEKSAYQLCHVWQSVCQFAVKARIPLDGF